MIRTEQKNLAAQINMHEPTFLPHANRKGYICPKCGNGSGRDGDGITRDKRDGSHFKCFKCGMYADVVALYGITYGIEGFVRQVKGAAQYFGLQDITPASDPLPRKQTAEAEKDLQSFFSRAYSRISETDYPARRGLSPETVARFRLGYDPAWKHPKAPGSAPRSPRLIIPTGPASYLARDVRQHVPEKEKSYQKSKVGSVQIFNMPALQQREKPVFVVEGEIDAMSIVDVGGEAVALGSTSQIRQFVRLVELDKPAKPIIVALDNDSAGNAAASKLAADLAALGVPHTLQNVCGGYKDANEALQKDRASFTAAVRAAEEAALQPEKAEYLRNSAANCLNSFIDGIVSSADTPSIPTGFAGLDAALDGGLYEGLYIVGAISSLGKTTLMLQIADQIATDGRDVLVFSLEMARSELISKSISRYTFTIAKAEELPESAAKTARGITDGKRYVRYSDTENYLIQKAISTYATSAEHVFICEGVGDIGPEQVRQAVERHIRITGNHPVVVIDYLQILAPYSERMTDKQNTDKAVLELKRISRDHKLPVIAISSFNRANYREAVTMEAFKESGAIEYSSDVLMGLQLKGAGEKEFDANEAKRKIPREVELVILKNRNGRTGDKLSFQYQPLFNHFAEAACEATEEPTGKRRRR